MNQPDAVIFFLPFAGGGAHSLLSLGAKMKHADKQMLEWPGRGQRFSEPPLRSFDDIAEDIYQRMVPVVDSYPRYFIFGHSMGATMAYLVAHKMGERKKRYPEQLFVSGAGAPVCRKKRGWHQYPKDEFWNKLRDLGGCPKEVLDSPELMEFAEPIIRADFEALDSYEYREAAPLPVPIMAFRGTHDESGREDFEAWQQETSLPLELHELEGDHFFIFEQAATVAGLMNQAMSAANTTHARPHTSRLY